MRGFELLRPEWLPLVALGLVPVALGLWALKARMAGLRALAEPRHLPRLFPGLRFGSGDISGDILRWFRRRAILRAVLGALTVVLLSLAFIGPVKGFSLVPVQSQQVDIVVALDTSRSMMVEDVSPNRLDRAKAEIGALLDVTEGERLAIVGFAGSARAVTPLTRDLDTARYFLERMSPDDNRKGGTDIGAALRLALERFEDASGANEAIILVTDGEDLTGEGFSAAERAADRGIVVHVLGMGTEIGGKIPDGGGGFVVDPDSGADRSEVISKLSPDSLKAIADVSGGIYLQAKGRVLPLEELYKRGIQPLEGREIIDGKERVPQDRFQWPLGLALVLLLFEASLRDTRRPKRGRGPGWAALALILAGCGDVADVPPWDGTLGSGVLAMSEQSMGGDVDGALAIADRMLAPGSAAQLRQKLNRATRGVSESVLSPITRVLDLVGVSALSPEDRGEIEYARAAALLTGASKGEEDAPGLIERAQAALERARGAAPGEPRMDAVYNLGTLDLLAAEAVRATIPEIAGENKTDEAEEDPLPIARALYSKARGGFVEYLTQAPGEDAAANVEFVIRRLRELDEIETQRQQQDDQSQEGDEGEESDEQKSEDDQEQDDQEQDDSEKSEDGDPSDEQKSDEQESSDDQQSSEEDSKEEQESSPGEEEQEEQQDPGAEDGSEEQEEESDDSIDQPAPGEEEIEETTMTAEEFQRLLERNSKHQERGEEIRRIRMMRGKIPAKKDW